MHDATSRNGSAAPAGVGRPMGRAPRGVARRAARVLAAVLVVAAAVLALPAPPTPAFVPPVPGEWARVPVSIETHRVRFEYEAPPEAGGGRYLDCQNVALAVFDSRYASAQPGGSYRVLEGNPNNQALLPLQAFPTFELWNGSVLSWGQGAGGSPMVQVSVADRSGANRTSERRIIMFPGSEQDAYDRCDDLGERFDTHFPQWAADFELWSRVTTIEAPPTAGFRWEVTDRPAREVTFTSTSSDTDGASSALAHHWAFGDGSAPSTAPNPVHRYPRSGVFDVTLTVTDADGLTDTMTERVTVPGAGLRVNSTGDAGAVDTEARGCDTGQMVGDEPECTLRAALETADEQGGGDISFAIDGGGVPTVAVGAPLPEVAHDTVIDGTTQPGAGQVEVTGTSPVGLALTGGTSSVRGLVVNGFAVGVRASGGSGHEVVGNVFGADPAGTEARSGPYAVAVEVPDVVVADNVVGTETGIGGRAGATGLVVRDNLVGVGTGGAPLGSPLTGVGIAAADAEVRGNVVRATSVGIEVLQAGAAGAVVADNDVGVSPSGAAFPGTGYGVRVDGAPDVTIEGNRVVADGYAPIAVAGSDQTVALDDGQLELRAPDDEALDGPVTGGRTVVTGNRVGLAGGAPAGGAEHGIVAWAGGSGLVVTDNVVGGVEEVGIAVDGGTGHRIGGNTVGSAAGPAGTGIAVVDAPATTVGGTGTAANTVSAHERGVAVTGSSTGARVEGNTVGAADPVDWYVGIEVGEDAASTSVVANAVRGGGTGIGSQASATAVTGNLVVADDTEAGIAVGGAAPQVTGNEVRGAAVGVAVDAADAALADNAVHGGGDGIVVAGEGAVLARNRVGLAPGADTVVGNTGTGIRVESGRAELTRNVVAGNGRGIDVLAAATATLAANRVWRSAEQPVVVAEGPDAPDLRGVIRSGTGDATRTTLLVGGLPEDGGGLVEVFANDTCADPEAQYLLETVRTTKPGQPYRIVQVRGAASRDHYTVTYTSPDGVTSELSGCASVEAHPDGDGDGSVDPLDGLVGTDDDPRNAVVVTDDEGLLLVSVANEGATLERVALGADPAPGGHPEGWELAYGALGFRVAGLEPGAAALVTLTSLEGDQPTAGSSYWKYGPATVGADPTWYAFTVDEATGTGATLTTATVLGEPRRVWALQLVDGARGDSDGGANGTITDPGGPVVGAPDVEVPEGPEVEVPPVTTPRETPRSTPGPAGPGRPAAATGGSGGGLARTGADVVGLVVVGAALVLVGTGLALGRRRSDLAARRP